MPPRNLIYEALVLRARESPGGSRILTLMTAEAGLVDVFVFGGPKSKLRSLASPYASGRAFVYLDPVKDFQKLSDFEVNDSYPALRDELERLWSAGLVAELLIKTSGGGGDYPLVLDLARSCLQALDEAGTGAAVPAVAAFGGAAPRAAVLGGAASGTAADGGPSTSGGHGATAPILAFIWRLIGLIGIGPDPGACSLCGTRLKAAAGGAYSFVREGFLCPSCAARESGGPQGATDASEAGTSQGDASRFVGGRGRILRLGPDAFRWLEAATYRPFAEAARAPIAADCADSLKALVFGLARRAAEAPLASFSRGAGLL